MINLFGFVLLAIASVVNGIFYYRTKNAFCMFTCGFTASGSTYFLLIFIGV